MHTRAKGTTRRLWLSILVFLTQCSQIHTNTCTHAHVCTCMHVCMHTRAHAHVHVHLHVLTPPSAHSYVSQLYMYMYPQNSLFNRKNVFGIIRLSLPLLTLLNSVLTPSHSPPLTLSTPHTLTLSTPHTPHASPLTPSCTTPPITRSPSRTPPPTQHSLSRRT